MPAPSQAPEGARVLTPPSPHLSALVSSPSSEEKPRCPLGSPVRFAETGLQVLGPPEARLSPQQQAALPAKGRAGPGQRARQRPRPTLTPPC